LAGQLLEGPAEAAWIGKTEGEGGFNYARQGFGLVIRRQDCCCGMTLADSNRSCPGF
jgi:hypothetical protein